MAKQGRALRSENRGDQELVSEPEVLPTEAHLEIVRPSPGHERLRIDGDAGDDVALKVGSGCVHIRALARPHRGDAGDAVNDVLADSIGHAGHIGGKVGVRSGVFPGTFLTPLELELV